MLRVLVHLLLWGLLVLAGCGAQDESGSSVEGEDPAVDAEPTVESDAAEGSASEGAAAEETASSEDPFASYRGMMQYYARAAAAEHDGEFEQARAFFREGLELVPTSPHLLMGLARNAALLGDRSAALAALDRFAAIGGFADLRGMGAFAEMSQDPEFLRISTTVPPVDAAAPKIAPRVVLTPEDLWNEGIACDLQTGELYAGSVKHGRIVRVRGATQEDFGTSASDGLMEVIGLDVDEERRELWACTGRDEPRPDGRHDFGESPRANAIVVYSLDSGEQLRRWYAPPSDPIHMWNDISVAPDGTAYFTDMSAGEVHRILEGGAPELFLDLEDWNYPNGIAVDDDGELLYLACLEGVMVVDLATRELAPLLSEAPLHTGLGDGMALRGRDLFVVQNNQLLGFRVLHCRLDQEGRGVEWSEALRFERNAPMMPFTCALGEEQLYVNLTLSFDQYDRAESGEEPGFMREYGSRILALDYRR